MGQITATTERVIDAPVAAVRAALADYEQIRPQILTDRFSEYRVESGGHGAGTRAHWKLAATKKRTRDCLVDVVESVEAGRSKVRTITTWNGASGIGGFFERTFAPKGLARIYDDVLANLEQVVRA